MNEEDLKAYRSAVDTVCLNCMFRKDACESCPVRKTMDLTEMSEKESALIDYILESMHWCPFADESGVDFNRCVGFGKNGCKECIYRNTDKLLKGR